MRPIRILIADDHDFVRQGVRAVLEAVDGWTVCGEASNGREAVALAVALHPDVVVLDIAMPELNGLEVTRQILRLVETSIVILTMHDSEQMLTEILAAGARGYVLKSESKRTLVNAIDAILANQPFVSNRIVQLAAGGGSTHLTQGTIARPLTAREREVLQLLTEGKSNKEVAAKLDISVKTVETHRARVMAKLNLHSMSDLVRYAVRNRIIEA
jgi:DNA-binding NarL/FixJ family response regulator